MVGVMQYVCESPNRDRSTRMVLCVRDGVHECVCVLLQHVLSLYGFTVIQQSLCFFCLFFSFNIVHQNRAEQQHSKKNSVRGK